ncbi:hypothetical protein [Candidatus Mycoplasma haematohominis]|uniref:hypothetical protein n=1 Tax=Candidatus Mycoplasma haematohominis TaxID=1494318 RepID=UPI001C0A73D7|nr:hypothetical protein [Candidatus Mycoplasma haemohominis]
MKKLSQVEKKKLIEYINKFNKEYEFKETNNKSYRTVDLDNVQIYAQPDGIALKKGIIKAILMITIFTNCKCEKDEKPHLSQILQLATYLYIFIIDTGFICSSNLPASKSLSLGSPLNLKTEESKKISKLEPRFSEIKPSTIDYTIIETWKKNSKLNPIYLWKIKINNLNNLENILQEISEWWKGKKYTSPPIDSGFI